MLSGSAVQAALESKHPGAVCDGTSQFTLFGHGAEVRGLLEKHAHNRCTASTRGGPSTPFGFASLRSG